MKKTALFVCVMTILAVASCSRDYSKEILGKWNAGKATRENEIRVDIRADGTFTAELTNLDVKPATGTYALAKNRVIFKFPGQTLDYKIVKLDRDVLVMRSEEAKITWKRIK